MKENSSTPYFSNEELVKFEEIKNKSLLKVICYLWQNFNDKNNVVELIDRIELTFDDTTTIGISCNAEGNGLECSTEDMKQTAIEVEKEFEGKIKIFVVEASSTSMWKELIGQKLIGIQLSKESDYYKADSLVLNFGNELRIISIHPLDGLIIDFYEPD
jgi:hypothetical protein